MALIKRTKADKPLPRYLNKKDTLRGSCYLCGATEDLTREHVFSRNLFRPDDIERPVILSACSACNGRKEHGEDYVFTYAIWTTETPEAEKQRERFEKAYKARQSSILRPGGQEPPKGNKLFANLVTKMKDVPVYSSQGIYLGSGGKVKIDPERFTTFYVDICKGLYTSAANRIIDWDRYAVHSQFDTFTFGKHWNKDVFLFAVNNAQFHEEWGQYLFFAGFVFKKQDGKEVSMWSLALYDEHLACVIFEEK